MKRPALRGDVTRAGATCDARLLSCSFFEPSVLPLPWAFCRGPARQNWALSGVASVTGKLGDVPASLRFSALILKVSVGKTVSRDSGAQRPQHRVSVSQRCTGATQVAGVPQTALQRETGGFTVLTSESNQDRQLLAEKILSPESMAAPTVFETF